MLAQTPERSGYCGGSSWVGAWRFRRPRFDRWGFGSNDVAGEAREKFVKCGPRDRKRSCADGDGGFEERPEVRYRKRVGNVMRVDGAERSQTDTSYYTDAV